MKRDKDHQKNFSENPATYIYDPKELAALHDPTAAYATKSQGMFTVEDYYALPEERRVELIDGVIYDMGAPTSAHQFIAVFISAKLFSHVSSRNGKCLPLVSPIDVQLDCDDKTMLQPDVILVCDPSKNINRCIYGAPDFVVEILSPSSRQKDMLIKFNKYLRAGVREYWIVDPMKKEIQVYDFSQGNAPTFYTFEDKVPVAVLNHELVIDFAEIYKHIPVF